MNIKQIFKTVTNKVVDYLQKPTVKCKVKGFDFSVEKKHVPDPANDNENISYYELSVRANGQNPEYPEDKEPTICRYSIGLNNEQRNAIGNNHSQMPDGRWIKFELTETFSNSNTAYIGKKMPPHHTVMINAHYKRNDGSSSRMGSGRWIRKSELESPAWKKAKNKRGTYIGF